MSEIQEEQIDVLTVPINSDYDVNVAGYTFETKRAVEGVILAILFGGLSFALFTLIGLKMTIRLTLTGAFAVVGFALAVKGINGDSITDYLLNIMRFNKKKRITYYNPDIKNYLKFFTSDLDAEQTMIPRERLEMLIRKYITKQDTKQAHNNFRDEENTVIYFEDDIEQYGKPLDLMTPSERRKAERQRKKMAKEKAKMDAKQRRINEKMRKREERF